MTTPTTTQKDNRLTREQVKLIHEKLQPMLDAFFKEHGLKLKKSNCTYSDYEMRFSIHAAKDAPEAEAETARKVHGYSFKLYGIDYGTELTDATGKRRFAAIGFNRAGKLQVRDLANGKTYKGEPAIFYLKGQPLREDWERTR
jgi:hypothetical protein